MTSPLVRCVSRSSLMRCMQCARPRSATRKRMARVTAVHSEREQVPVFQLDTKQTLSIADVRDAYEVCSLIPNPNDRQQCYSVFGLDSQRMANYYETVMQLEDQFATDLNTSNYTSLGAVLGREDPDDYFTAPAECSYTE